MYGVFGVYDVRRFEMPKWKGVREEGMSGVGAVRGIRPIAAGFRDLGRRQRRPRRRRRRRRR
jgi:hypothetical protein